MSLAEIQSAVRAGRTVYWASRSYQVTVDPVGQWFIRCLTGYCIGLTRADGITLNGKSSDFYLA